MVMIEIRVVLMMPINTSDYWYITLKIMVTEFVFIIMIIVTVLIILIIMIY